jgi:hypothetical protein
MTGRRDQERHNAEFVALYRKSGMTQCAIAEALGVSLITVKLWCVPEGTEMARVCPKWCVDTLKIVLDLKLKDRTSKQREEVLDILRGI